MNGNALGLCLVGTFLRTHQSVPKMDVSLMSQVKAQASCSARVKLDSRVELHRLEFHSEFTSFNSTAHAELQKENQIKRLIYTHS